MPLKSGIYRTNDGDIIRYNNTGADLLFGSKSWGQDLSRLVKEGKAVLLREEIDVTARTEHTLLNRDRLWTEVGCDGPSLPILTLGFQAGSRRSCVLLNKEQTEKLVADLQKKLGEM